MKFSDGAAVGPEWPIALLMIYQLELLTLTEINIQKHKFSYRFIYFDIQFSRFIDLGIYLFDFIRFNSHIFFIYVAPISNKNDLMTLE